MDGVRARTETGTGAVPGGACRESTVQGVRFGAWPRQPGRFHVPELNAEARSLARIANHFADRILGREHGTRCIGATVRG